MYAENRSLCENVELLLAELSGMDVPAGAQAEEDRDELLRHVAACPRCARAVQRYRRTVELVRALPPVRAPSDFVANVIGEVERDSFSRRLRQRRAVPALAVAALCLLAVLVAFLARWTSPWAPRETEIARVPFEPKLEQADLAEPASEPPKDAGPETPPPALSAAGPQKPAEPLEGQPSLVFLVTVPSRDAATAQALAALSDRFRFAAPGSVGPDSREAAAAEPVREELRTFAAGAPRRGAGGAGARPKGGTPTRAGAPREPAAAEGPGDRAVWGTEVASLALEAKEVVEKAVGDASSVQLDVTIEVEPEKLQSFGEALAAWAAQQKGRVDLVRALGEKLPGRLESSAESDGTWRRVLSESKLRAQDEEREGNVPSVRVAEPQGTSAELRQKGAEDGKKLLGEKFDSFAAAEVEEAEKQKLAAGALRQHPSETRTVPVRVILRVGEPPAAKSSP